VLYFYYRGRLNGKNLGIVWTAPWSVEITGVVKAAGNQLEIDVVYLWPNRLAADAALPAEKRLTRTNITIKKETPLLPSGLLDRLLLSNRPKIQFRHAFGHIHTLTIKPANLIYRLHRG
jgi:hypothetical protein